MNEPEEPQWYPSMRAETLDAMSVLADKQYQERHWKQVGNHSSELLDSFELAVHWLFDDTVLSSNARELVGWCLHTNEEADAVQRVAKRLDEVIDDLGIECTGEECLQSSKWDGVVQAAKEALALLKDGDAKYGARK